MKTVEIHADGYAKRYQFERWLIAGNGYREGTNDPHGVRTLGRHFQTDEAFVLLSGAGFLITAGTADAPGELQVHAMEAGKLMVVERREWHALVLRENAQTLIVENADTGAENSAVVSLNAEQKAYIAGHTAGGTGALS